MRKQKSATGSKRELKRLLNRHISGLTSSMRYQILKEAEDYALAHGLAFPDDAKKLLREAAREWLGNVLDWREQQLAIAAKTWANGLTTRS